MIEDRTMPKSALSHEEILELRAAALAARLGESRAALLAGMPAAFIAGLAQATTPGDQLLMDLDAINAAGTLSEGEMPLSIWLRNAEALVGPRAEAKIFAAALERWQSVVTAALNEPPRTIAPQSSAGIAFARGPFAVILREHGDAPVIVGRSPFRIGRHPQMDYALTDGDVSRHHTTVLRDGDHFVIEDQGSSHGTLVNGIRASRMRLRSDDILDVGSCRLTIRICDSLDAVDAEIERAARIFDSHRFLTTLGRRDDDQGASSDGWFLARVKRAITDAEPAQVCFVELERAGMIERVYGPDVARQICDHIAGTLSFHVPLTMSLVSISTSKIALVGTWETLVGDDLRDSVRVNLPREMKNDASSVRFSAQVLVTSLDDAVERI